MHFELLALDQCRCCGARAMPVPKTQTSFVEACSEIAHHPRQETQLECRIGFNLLDGLASELVAPALHTGDEIGFFLGRTIALDHAVDNGAEGGLKEAEDVIN